MLEKKTLSGQTIINCLQADYGIEVATLIFLPIGADANASVYKAESLSGSSYFIKLKQGHNHDVGVTLLTLLHDAGIRQIIPSIKSIHKKLSVHLDDFTLIVFPFIEGRDGFSHTLTDNQWITLGKVLRQVHEFKVSPSFQDCIDENYSPKWREAIRSLYIHMEGNINGDEPALQLLSFMTTA